MPLYLITASKAILNNVFSVLRCLFIVILPLRSIPISFDHFILNITVLDTCRVSSSSGSGKCNRRRIDGESRPSLKSAALLRGWKGLGWRLPKDAVKEKLIQSVVRPGTSLKKGPLRETECCSSLSYLLENIREVYMRLFSLYRIR